MNKNLNLAQILKRCPKGTKLYSLIHGDVEFYAIDKRSSVCPIILKCGEDLVPYSVSGKYIPGYRGECVLFPSKEQRDWSKFKAKEEAFVPPCKFKDGDIVATKDGSQVFILKRDDSNGKGYCYTGYNFTYDEPFCAGVWQFSRFATEGEKRKFFDAIKLKGYKWNAETKTLEKLIQPKFKVGDKIRHKGFNKDSIYEISKVYDDSYGIAGFAGVIYMKYQDRYELVPSKFDPKTLKPFDKVLVRDDCESVWQCDIFSHINYGLEVFRYKCTGCSYRYCIPYNDDTKHLIGTTKEAPEYYRYWEE